MASSPAYTVCPLSALDIELQFGPPNIFERELILQVQSPVLALTPEQEVLIAPIVTYLKKLGYPLEHSMISYYSQVAGVYIYCGNDPLPSHISVPLFEVKTQRVTHTQLTLKCREAVKSDYGTPITIGAAGSDLPLSPDDCSARTPRRTKERKIGYIIEKVSKWRQLYSGACSPDGAVVKYTLEEAAALVGISKKSLDDYLLQLRCRIGRFGKKFGFNFQEHRDDKVGVLRAYVKRYKQQAMHLGEESADDYARVGQLPTCKHAKCCHPPTLLDKSE